MIIPRTETEAIEGNGTAFGDFRVQLMMGGRRNGPLPEYSEVAGRQYNWFLQLMHSHRPFQLFRLLHNPRVVGK